MIANAFLFQVQFTRVLDNYYHIVCDTEKYGKLELTERFQPFGMTRVMRGENGATTTQFWKRKF